MIYHRICPICKKEFRVNGEMNMRFIYDKHFKDNHPIEYLKLQNLRTEITIAIQKVNNYERELGF